MPYVTCAACGRLVHVKDGVEQPHDGSCYLDGVASEQLSESESYDSTDDR